MSDIYIIPYTGLGDTVYQRPFVKNAAAKYDRVFFRTPWPEVFSDIENVYPVKPHKDFRTQTENIGRRPDFKWATVPPKTLMAHMGYAWYELSTVGIMRALEVDYPFKTLPFNFDLPAKYNECPIDSKGKPIAVVRPPTVRREWMVPSRNTLTGNINFCAEELRKRGYFVVSLAHLKKDAEWLTGPPVTADLYLHKGELNVEQLIGLMRHTAIAVGNSGWIVPMAIACGTPLFIVWGGRGGYDRHDTILDKRMNLSKVGWAYPPNFCLCVEDDHSCQKKIPKLPFIFDFFLRKINNEQVIRVPA